MNKTKISNLNCVNGIPVKHESHEALKGKKVLFDYANDGKKFTGVGEFCVHVDGDCVCINIVYSPLNDQCLRLKLSQAHVNSITEVAPQIEGADFEVKYPFWEKDCLS